MMVTITEVLKLLSRNERKKLDYGFEQGISIYILLDNGTRFVGVNTDTVPQLKPLVTAGRWTYGEILHES